MATISCNLHAHTGWTKACMWGVRSIKEAIAQACLRVTDRQGWSDGGLHRHAVAHGRQAFGVCGLNDQCSLSLSAAPPLQTPLSPRTWH